MSYENELRRERGRRKEKVCEKEIEERIGEEEGSEEVGLFSLVCCQEVPPRTRCSSFVFKVNP